MCEMTTELMKRAEDIEYSELLDQVGLMGLSATFHSSYWKRGGSIGLLLVVMVV